MSGETDTKGIYYGLPEFKAPVSSALGVAVAEPGRDLLLQLRRRGVLSCDVARIVGLSIASTMLLQPHVLYIYLLSGFLINVHQSLCEKGCFVGSSLKICSFTRVESTGVLIICIYIF